MKVCMITGEYPPMIGGIGDYTAGLVAALPNETIVLTNRRAAGLRVESSPGWGLRHLPFLVRKVKALRPTLAHIQYQAAAFDLGGAVHLLPSLLKPIPTITTFHDTREPYILPKAGGLRHRANVRLARTSAAVVVTNPDDAAALAGYGARRAALIPLGNNVPKIALSAEECAVYRTKLGAGAGACLIGHFGLMGPTKGLETLLDAIADRPNIRLALIGSSIGDTDKTNAAASARVLAQINRLELQDRTCWTGEQPVGELSKYLQACDAIALPYADGASFRRTTLVAALANGCATVTTTGVAAGDSAAGLPVLHDGANVLLVPPGSPHDLQAALSLLLGDASLRRRLGECAEHTARAFDWQRVAAQHSALYQETTVGL